jgi:GT2 family glycosyltransferase
MTRIATRPILHELAVVVPSHETREMTLRCLASIVAAAPDARVVLVDDASTDGTAEAVRERISGVRVLVNETRRGFSYSVNRGAAVAEGEVILILNSDTELSKPSLCALARAFATEEWLGIAGGRLEYPDGRTQWSYGAVPDLAWFAALGSGAGALLGGLRFWRRRPLDPRSAAVLPVGWVTGAALAIRREAWSVLGGFAESFAFYAQDLDLCTRCRRAGWWVGVVPEFRVVHRHGATIARVRPERNVARGQPDLLWSDLVHWAERHRDETWARRAAWCLATAARLRLALRHVAVPLLPPRRRRSWRRDSVLLADALRALRARRTPSPLRDGEDR